MDQKCTEELQKYNARKKQVAERAAYVCTLRSGRTMVCLLFMVICVQVCFQGTK